MPLYLQEGNPTAQSGEAQSGEEAEPGLSPNLLLERLRHLSERALSDGWHNVTILPQLHVLIYGNKQGV